MIFDPNRGILLVEHNLSDAELTKTAILRSKVTDQVFWVQDGEEAFNFIFAKAKYEDRNIHSQPRVIVLNLDIPKISAIEILKSIKSHAETKNIIVMLLADSVKNADLPEAMNIGVNNCLIKKSESGNFARLIEQELGYYWKLF